MRNSTSIEFEPRESETASARVATCLARIADQNEHLHAVSHLLAEHAWARATELDRLAATQEPRGALHGLPVLVKELVDIEGIPTRFGSLAYGTTPARETAPALRRLEDAGAILLGTTHMVEFAIGSWGTNHARGTPWNPVDARVHRVPGGSSSGSAVAVAAGLAPVAIGSDTGGSIRIPASLCGVVGFKPTYGLIPTDGVAPLGPTFDTLGPITHCVSDARRLTEVMAGVSLAHPAVAIDDLRIAIVTEAALAQIAEEVAAAYTAALSGMRALGARVEEIALPLPFVEFQSLNGDIVAFEAYRHLSQLAEDPSSPLDPFVRKRVLAGRDVDPEHYQAQLRRLHDARLSFAPMFSGFDLLVLPGTPICALPLSEVDERQIPMSRYTRVANCLDLCAITLPLSRPAGALPIGLQLCAAAHSDARLLAIADAIGHIL